MAFSRQRPGFPRGHFDITSTIAESFNIFDGVSAKNEGYHGDAVKPQRVFTDGVMNGLNREAVESRSFSPNATDRMGKGETFDKWWSLGVALPCDSHHVARERPPKDRTATRNGANTCNESARRPPLVAGFCRENQCAQ